jgi:hydroxyacylglutathione hydrolase
MERRSGVHTFEIDWGYDEPLGVHVLETGVATVLFGAGAEASAEAVTNIATTQGVDAVVVEHGDGDHYGGVPALRAAVEDIEVAVPAGDAGFLEEAGIDVDRALEAGDTVWGIETVPTPGHTPDNMAYVHEDVLVAGDTVVGADSAFAASGNWSGPLAPCTPDYNHDDKRTRESIPALADFDVEVVLVSHGQNVTGEGSAAIDRLVADLD